MKKTLLTKRYNQAIDKEVSYTRKRELAFIRDSIIADGLYLGKLKELYNRVSISIQADIKNQYLRYASKEGLDINAAYEKASKMDVKAFAEKAKRYVENRDFSDQANAELRLYNLKMRTSRIELMKREIELHGLKLYDKEYELLATRLSQDSIKEIERQAGILGLSEPTRKALLRNVDKIILGDFQGAPFSSRIWANKEELVSRLQVGLERSLLLGEHPYQWANRLADLVDKETGVKGGGALFKAHRLAITESARVMTEVQLDSFCRGGYSKYEWIAEIDHRTCPICEAMDGRIFDAEKSAIGGNLPPLHPFCRCSIAAVVDKGYNEEEPVEDQSDEAIRSWINDHDKILNEEKFREHHPGSPNYDSSKSSVEMSYDAFQNLISEKASSGEIIRTHSGKWTKKVIVQSEEVVGTYRGQTLEIANSHKALISFKNKKYVHGYAAFDDGRKHDK